MSPSYPPDLPTVLLTFGPYLTASGDPAPPQRFTISPPVPLRHAASGAVILPARVTIETGPDGRAEIRLPATDTTLLDPTGFAYAVDGPAWAGGTVYLACPAATPVIDFDQARPVPESDGVPLPSVWPWESAEQAAVSATNAAADAERAETAATDAATAATTASTAAGNAATAATAAAASAATAAAEHSATVTSGEVVGDTLILTRTDGTQHSAGNVRGPEGPPADMTMEICRNWAPPLTIPGPTVEVRRNHALNPGARSPYLSEDLNYWAGSGGTANVTWVDAAWSRSGRARRVTTTKVASAPPVTQIAGLNRTGLALTSGTWTVVQHVKLPDGVGLGATEFSAPGTGNSLLSSGSVDLGGGVWKRWATISLTTTGSSWTGNPRVDFFLSTPPAVGAEVEVSMTDIYSGEYVAGRGWFDGEILPAEETPLMGLTPSWVGAASASQAILTGIQPANVVATRCYAVQSDEFAPEGGKSLRLIPSVGSRDSFAEITVPSVARASGTAVAMLHLKAPQTGTMTFPRALRSVLPDTSTSAPNEVGSHLLRHSWSDLTSPATLRLMNGTHQGGGDVYWTVPTLVAGEYSLAPFDLVTDLGDGATITENSDGTTTLRATWKWYADQLHQQALNQINQ